MGRVLTVARVTALLAPARLTAARLTAARLTAARLTAALLATALLLTACGDTAALAPTAAGPTVGRNTGAGTGATGGRDGASTRSSASSPAGNLGSGDGSGAQPAPADRNPGWVAAENQAEGTDNWKIRSHNPAAAVEGYASTTSTAPGADVTVFVNTRAPTFRALVYRMGFYGGKRGRLVWSSDRVTGERQRLPSVNPVTGAVEAAWNPSFTIPVGSAWLTGAYLVKLVSSGGDESYVPFTVHDDRAWGDVVVVDAVSTWQAYNTWGGCSLYECPGFKGRTRAVKVSFDRPYDRSFNDGSADFLDHELSLIALVEELGIDARYDSSVDLHQRPWSIAPAKAVLSLGHDEYYSARMRQALVDAAGQGVNLAFFGANAIYRHVRFEPSTDGRPDRLMVNYRGLSDPVTADATLQWREQGKPEAAIVGIQYLCPGVNTGLVVAASSHWVWDGAKLHDGQILPAMVGNEADGIDLKSSPANLDVLAASPVRCGPLGSTAATAYHSMPSGAGVFASGTIWWVCSLDAQYCSVPANIAPVRTATANVLRTFAQGPAGRAHPSGRYGPGRDPSQLAING